MEENESDELADDSGDEKKLRSPERRALSKLRGRNMQSKRCFSSLFQALTRDDSLFWLFFPPCFLTFFNRAIPFSLLFATGIHSPQTSALIASSSDIGRTRHPAQASTVVASCRQSCLHTSGQD